MRTRLHSAQEYEEFLRPRRNATTMQVCDTVPVTEVFP